MSETQVSGTGFTATQSQSSTITPNADSGQAPGYGGKFFDDIAVEPKASDIQTTTLDTLSDGGEAPVVAEEPVSEAAAEADGDVQEATAEGEGSAVAKTAKTDAPKIKSYKVSAGDKKLDLPLDAKFTIPVDGKSTPVSVDELVRSYNGKVSWDKRFTALDKDRKAFTQEKSAHEADKKSLNDGLGQFFKLVQQKKGPQAWTHLIKMAGLDGQYSLQDLRREVLEQARELEAMSPAERAAREAQEQAEFYRSEFEQLSNSQKAQQAQAQAEAALDQVLGSHSISREQFGQYHDQLVKGGVDAAEITPELVVSYHQRIDAYSAIRQAAEKTDPAILGNDKLVSRLRDFKLANPDVSAADIADVIKSWKGENRARKISEKVRTTKTATSASVRQTPPRAPSGQFVREDFMF